MCDGFSDDESDDESAYVDVGMNHGRSDQIRPNGQVVDCQERPNNLAEYPYDAVGLAESLKRGVLSRIGPLLFRPDFLLWPSSDEK